ncbi:unnamed protein product, partial [marine sediment metagenome]
MNLVKNERIIRAVAQVNTPEELTALLNQPSKIYRLKIELDSIRLCPPESTVSRTIDIEGSDTLNDLHLEIQRAFGWDNDHLLSFYMSNRLGDGKSE